MSVEDAPKPEAAAPTVPETETAAEKPTELATEPATAAVEPAAAPQEASQEAPKEAPQEAAAEAPKEAPAEAPKDNEAGAETPKEASKEEAAKGDASATPKPTPIGELWALAQSNGHPEIWGVTLADPSAHIPTQIILQKYLNANDGDLAKAKDQLTKTLEWRAKTKPLELVKKVFNKTKFEGLGYVTSYVGDAADANDPANKEVFTWNIYGGVKSIEETFGNLEEFIEWRVALMELALADLPLSTATKPITADSDPYKIFQVHDYKSISFLRQSPQVKAASTETIKIFAQNYPELLKEKFFVNVPAVMGFIYAFVKLFVAPKTAKKFHPMSSGAGLAKEFGAGSSTSLKGLGEKLPAEYGGKGEALGVNGRQPLLE